VPTTRRVSALLALLILTLLLPLPQGNSDGVPEFRVNLSSAPLAFATDESDDDIWVSDPMEVEATTVGMSWDPDEEPDGLAWVRTSPDGEEWSEWVVLNVDEVHAPDPDTEEAKNARPSSSPVMIDDDRYVQFRVEAEHAPNMQAELLDARPKSAGLIERIPMPSLSSADAAPSRPTIVSRSQWGGDQCSTARASYSSNARVMFVHHTVTTNGYSSAAQARQQVFNICSWHVNANGWKDIGYNFLVDKYGNIYEGRRGGVDRAVIGAHTGGYNSGSIGVAFLGTHTTTAPTAAARAAFVQLAAWKMDLHGINPHGRSGVNGRTFNNLSGHRDAGSTACPGNACYRLLGTFRDQIQGRMVGFEDVGGSSHINDILAISEAGITRGCNPPANTRFCPKDPVTREQMAAFMVRALGLTRTSSAGNFRDVSSSSTFAADINRLATAGITRGCNPPANDRFCPKDRVSRQEMAAFIVRAESLSRTSSAGNFSDVSSSNTFSRDINRLATAGVTRGCNPPSNTRFCPRDAVTREQMASFIRRGMM
jgi:hypothetical protein